MQWRILCPLQACIPNTRVHNLPSVTRHALSWVAWCTHDNYAGSLHFNVREPGLHCTVRTAFAQCKQACMMIGSCGGRLICFPAERQSARANVRSWSQQLVRLVRPLVQGLSGVGREEQVEWTTSRHATFEANLSLFDLVPYPSWVCSSVVCTTFLFGIWSRKKVPYLPARSVWCVVLLRTECLWCSRRLFRLLVTKTVARPIAAYSPFVVVVAYVFTLHYHSTTQSLAAGLDYERWQRRWTASKWSKTKTTWGEWLPWRSLCIFESCANFWISSPSFVKLINSSRNPSLPYRGEMGVVILTSWMRNGTENTLLPVFPFWKEDRKEIKERCACVTNTCHFVCSDDDILSEEDGESTKSKSEYQIAIGSDSKTQVWTVDDLDFLDSLTKSHSFLDAFIARHIVTKNQTFITVFYCKGFHLC